MIYTLEEERWVAWKTKQIQEQRGWSEPMARAEAMARLKKLEYHPEEKDTNPQQELI